MNNKNLSLGRKKNRRWINALTDQTFIAPAFLFLFLFLAYPVASNFIMSVKNINISNLVSKSAEFVGLDNYKAVLANPYFGKSLINTLIFMVFCLLFQFVFGMILALFFNLKFVGAKWMRAIILVGWMNPIIITGTIFKWLLSGASGVVNYVLIKLCLIPDPIIFLATPTTALVSLIVTNIWIGIPFNMIILLAGMQNLPSDIYESADIDGANKRIKFFKITLPLLKPTIMILLMMGIIYSFKVFDLIFIMTKGGPARSSQILPYFSYELSFQMYKFGQGAAVSVIIFVIVMFFTLLYVKSSQKDGDLS